MSDGNSPIRPEDPRTVVKEAGLRLRKELGQNFLLSGRALERMVDAAEVGGEDAVLEIGTGLGRLTERLAMRAGRVVSVEIDRDLFGLASQRLSSLRNVRLLCCDFLDGKHNINSTVTEAVRQGQDDSASGIKVVSNLPYCISSSAVICLLEWEVAVRGIFVMLQADVADRFTARVGSAQYGPATVFVAYWSRARKLFTLPSRAFWPRPKVSSSFVAIIPSELRPPARDYEVFTEVVNGLFQSRRKTLAHALRIGWGRQAAERILDETALPPTIRPQRLTVADLVSIANALRPLQEQWRLAP